MRNRWPIVVSTLLAFALAVVSMPVAALGLGQIEVLSRPGEPLVAEIPIVTTDPAELRQLQARLASPDTFRRIGLEPPRGAVSNLQFSVALDAQGNPVVRVTSPAPIDQPLLTFLLEVDWGQGRLVREYSVLVDAPESAVAIAQPPIQAPQPAPSSTVVRPPDAVQPVATTPEVTAEPLPPEPVPQAPAPAQPTPQPPVPQQVQPPADIVQAPPPATPDAYTVQRGATLSEIAADLGVGAYSLNQTMLALLRANPDAFIDGNINLVRAGAVLRVPGRDVLAELSPSEANAVVRAQVRSWRERTAPPVVAADAVAEGATIDNADADADARTAGADPDASGAADARLEIVPPAGEAGQAPGSRSGLSAGGEGDMLRNDLRQAKEDLAARDAEVEELRARLAEVEDLQRKQAELLELKDSELAAVQQRLAESRADGTADPAATQATVAQPEPDAPASPLPWLIGGVLLLLAAAGAWWWQRSRRPVQPAPAPTPRRSYDTAAMAAGLSATARNEPVAKDAAPAATATRAATPPPTTKPAPAAPARTPEPVAAPAPPAAAPMPPATVDVPPPPAPESTPTWHAGTVPVVADAPAAPGVPLEAKGQANPSGRDGLELARAYLDLGDHQAARTLLREVLLGRDPGAREEAARMLRELG